MGSNAAKRLIENRGLLVLILVPCFGTSFVIAVAVGAVGSDIPRRANDGLTHTSARTVVATGESAEFGRYEILVSQSDKGRCEGVRFVDDGRPSPTVYEGCGLPSDFSIGSLSGERETFLYGQVPDTTDRIAITADGRPAGGAVSRESSARRFIGAAVPAGAKEIVVEARDSDGRSLGRQTVPTPGG